MDFGQALEYLRSGHKLCRRGWNGQNMFVYFVAGSVVNIENLRNEAEKHLGVKSPRDRGRRINISPRLDIKTSNNEISAGWRPTTIDMLANDWEVVK